MSEDDDLPLEELLKRVSQGDPIAREKLCERYAQAFYGLTQYLLFKGGCEVRDVHGPDIVQSLWTIIFKSLGDPSRLQSFDAWAKKILANLVLDHVTDPKECKNAPLSIDELDQKKGLLTAVINPAHVLMEYTVLLNELLKIVDPEHRQIFELRLLGFTHEEIGAMLGMTPNSVRSIYSREQRKLKYLLGDGKTVTKQRPLNSRLEPDELPLNRPQSENADDSIESEPLQRTGSDKAGLYAQKIHASESRGVGKEKQERLLAHQRKKGRRSPNDSSGRRRTR